MKHKVRTKIFLFAIETCIGRNILIVQYYMLYEKSQARFWYISLTSLAVVDL